MSRTRIVVGLVALVLGSGGWLLGQDAKKEARYKGQLPAGWKKLVLSEEQVQKIYKIQTDYRSRLDDLEEKIDKLKKQRQGEYEKVLTPAQRARLKELKEAGTKDDDAPAKKEPAKKPAGEKKE